MSYELGEDIDTAQAVKEGSSLAPAGKYTVMMTNYEEKIGKTSGDAYLNTTITIVDGPYRDKKFFKMFFLYSKNDTAKKIARAELSGIAVALGIEKLSNIDQIMHKPFECLVAIEEGTAGYPDKNKFVKALISDAQPKPATNAPKKEAQAKEFEDDIPF